MSQLSHTQPVYVLVTEIDQGGKATHMGLPLMLPMGQGHSYNYAIPSEYSMRDIHKLNLVRLYIAEIVFKLSCTQEVWTDG